MEKKQMEKYYKFGLYLVVVILINLVGLTLFFRTDLTSNGLYSLSKASQEAVSSLKQPLTIKVFFTKNLPAPYNTVETYLHDLLEEYEIHGNKYLNYQFFDVSAQEGDLSEEVEGNRKIAQDYGIYPVNVRKFEQDEAKVQRAYMGMVLLHGNVMEKIQPISTTEGLEYKITSTIQKMNNKISALLNLPEKIKIYLLQSSSLNQISQVVNLKGLDGLKNEMIRIVDQLRQKTYDQIEFIFVDPTTQSTDPEFLGRFARFRLEWPELKNPSGQVLAPAGHGILALGLAYGSKSIERQLLSKNLKLTNRGLEEQFEITDAKTIQSVIEDNLDNLIDINEDIGYLSSHGALPLSAALPPQLQMMRPQQESLSNLNAIITNTYSVKQVNLKDEEIPESVDTLIIAGPKENFSDWELLQIDQFLMKGKSLAIFADSFNEIQPQRRQMSGMNQPVYIPLNTGLEKLLNHYGLKVNKSYVLDENCYRSQGGLNQESMPYYFIPIIKNENINHDLPFMENIKQMVMMKISPLEPIDETIKKNSLKLRPLFSSTDRSWEMSGRINLMPWAMRPPADGKDRKKRELAYILEGEFPSYFADKQIPEKPRKEEKEDDKADNEKADDKDKKEEKKPDLIKSQLKKDVDILRKGKPGKILLIGSSQILKNNIIDQNGEAPNSVFVINALDYLNNREDMAVMRSKNQTFNPLRDSSAFAKRVIKVVNIGGLPVFFILFGVLIWLRRKTKRRAIQAMFDNGNKGGK